MDSRVPHKLRRDYFRQAKIFHENDTRIAGLLADGHLVAAELLANHSHEEAVRDRLRVLYGNHVGLEDNRAATVSWERG